jgi:hypothetical protein
MKHGCITQNVTFMKLADLGALLIGVLHSHVPNMPLSIGTSCLTILTDQPLCACPVCHCRTTWIHAVAMHCGNHQYSGKPCLFCCDQDACTTESVIHHNLCTRRKQPRDRHATPLGEAIPQSQSLENHHENAEGEKSASAAAATTA